MDGVDATEESADFYPNWSPGQMTVAARSGPDVALSA